MNSSFVTATYQVPWSDNLTERAQAIANGLAMSSSRQDELPQWLGEIANIDRPAHDIGLFSIRYPVHNIKPTIASLLTVVFGSLSLEGQIRLVGLDIPEAFLRQFPGPSHGVPGLRAKFGIHHRPFVMSVFKRENGATLEEFTDSFRQQIDGGVDWVKDDEIYFFDDPAPLLQRVAIAKRLLADRADQTGQLGFYAPNLTGTPREILDTAHRAIDAGAQAFLITPFVTGLDILVELRREHIEVPFIAHPAFSGGLVAPHTWGVASEILLGLLPRIAGADIVLFPSPYGSAAISRSEALAVHHRLSAPGQFPEVISGPSSGIHLGLVGQLLEDFGYDIVVNVENAIHGHPHGITAGARMLMDAVVDVCRGNA